MAKRMVDVQSQACVYVAFGSEREESGRRDELTGLIVEAVAFQLLASSQILSAHYITSSFSQNSLSSKGKTEVITDILLQMM